MPIGDGKAIAIAVGKSSVIGLGWAYRCRSVQTQQSLRLGCVDQGKPYPGDIGLKQLGIFMCCCVDDQADAFIRSELSSIVSRESMHVVMFFGLQAETGNGGRPQVLLVDGWHRARW